MTDFDKWFERLKVVAVEYRYSPKIIKCFNPEDWVDYYYDGASPEDALREDLMNG